MIEFDMMKCYQEHIVPWRNQNLDSIQKSLKTLMPSFSMDFDLPNDVVHSLMQHTLFLCKHSLKFNDENLARKALEIWELSMDDIKDSVLKYKNKYWITVKKDKCFNNDEISRDFMSPCYVITSEALKNGIQFADEEYFNNAWRLIELTDFFYIVELASSIIINLRYRDMSDSMEGYTLGPFKGTIYTDWTDAPLRYSESILHEAAHSWLNMVLNSKGVQVKNKKLYWSPWRGVKRPAIGIIHGTWAFSIVFHFYDRLSKFENNDMLNEKQLQYCRDRRDYELYRLNIVADYYQTALKEIDCTYTRSMVEAFYPKASLKEGFMNPKFKWI